MTNFAENKNSMYFELIYNSVASPELTSKDVLDILEESRLFNSKNDITGCLLYHKGEFLQLLEGEKSIVQNIYGKIEKDKRHHNVSLLLKNDIPRKAFNNWSMAFNELSDIDMAVLKDYLNLKEFDRLVNFLNHPFTAKTLFAYLGQTMIKK